MKSTFTAYLSATALALAAIVSTVPAPAFAAPMVLDVLGRYVCPNETPILDNGECRAYRAGPNVSRGDAAWGCDRDTEKCDDCEKKA